MNATKAPLVHATTTLRFTQPDHDATYSRVLTYDRLDSTCHLVTVIVRMEETSPIRIQNASPYNALSPTSIRLVEITPGAFSDALSIFIMTVDFNEQPQFDALSYVWNPKDGTIDGGACSESVFVRNYYSLEVGANLAAAMRHIRFPNKSCTFWIDALCMLDLDADCPQRLY
jgi:hypothetical protein